MKVPESVKKILKSPLGRLMGASEIKRLKGKKKFIIAVGDVSGKKLMGAGIDVDLWIYDGMETRKPVKWEIAFPSHIVSNPKGNITPPLMRAIDDALLKKEGKIFVKGEEDLATLYCIAVAPIGSLVVYGQPKKGMVVVDVDKESKKKAVSLIFKCK
jgi:uncharacterized protein (UPF0218 family)